MEEAESAPILSRKELRKQKLMEYLAAKAKIKLPTVGSPVHEGRGSQRATNSSLKGVAEKENKAPSDKIASKGSKGQTFTSQFSQDPPRRRPLGGNGNAKGGSLNVSKIHPSSGSATARPGHYQVPVLTKTHTAVSSKSIVTSNTSLRRQTNTRSQHSLNTSSNPTWTRTKSSFSRNGAESCPINTARISLGPLVLTKTGLAPTVTLLRSTQSHSAPQRTIAAEKIQPRASAPVSQKIKPRASAPVSQRFQPRASAPVSQRSSSSRARAEVLTQNKFKSKPPLSKNPQPACRSQSSGGLRATPSSFKRNAPPVMPGAKGSTSGSAAQPAERSRKETSAAEGEKRNRLLRAAPQTMSRSKLAAVTELGAKTNTSKETRSKASARALPSQPHKKPAAAPAMSRTVPQPSRSVRTASRATDMKTPKVTAKAAPQTEGKKVSAAQEERIKKLQEWREAKGISYKRPSMPVKPAVGRAASVGQPVGESVKTRADAHSLISAVDQSLTDCIKLLAEGCPPDQVKGVLSRLPTVSQKFAKYWICQARLMEREGNLEVLPVFQEAVRVVLEPVDELRMVVFEILRKKDELREKGDQGDRPATPENTPGSSVPQATPKPVRALINGERGDSSVVKYKITRTPGPPGCQFEGMEVRLFTPVRRSVRIDRASLRYPPFLQDHDVCISSYNDLIDEAERERCEKQKNEESSQHASDSLLYIYRENEALGDKVSVRLVSEDSL
ncbi:cytoskeleton-associated protein 2-like [Nothobranchius furzeri]|uniref:Cytoskeleton-associated protein 2-like n=2 Tax=Nothobranchius furzeri TaxID=105023 RepID=A0A9D3BEQ7_NOTFU|nr:cytoskeleton-associated protein 2-like [Nothobranchius furzeri]